MNLCSLLSLSSLSLPISNPSFQFSMASNQNPSISSGNRTNKSLLKRPIHPSQIEGDFSLPSNRPKLPLNSSLRRPMSLYSSTRKSLKRKLIDESQIDGDEDETQASIFRAWRSLSNPLDNANEESEKRRYHYMDINPQSKEVSLDLARELLIAISQSLPDNLLNSKSDKELSNGHDVAALANGDGAEELRSELISISYVPSPDKFVPPAMGIQE